MPNFTSNTYQMKRKILTFTNKISKHLSNPEKKFTANITYGMLASRSCLLTDVADQLHEPFKKINVVDRLSRHLEKGIPASAAASYLQQLKKWVPSEPVIHIDDSDVSFATAERAKLKQVFFIKEKTTKLTFHMSGYRSLPPEKIFIWYLFMALPIIQ